jgi:hypothetical protein
MGRLGLKAVAIMIVMAGLMCPANASDRSITVVFKDGHQKTFSVPDVSRIEFKGGNMVVSRGGHQESIPLADILRMDFSSAESKSLPFGRNHYIGKWEFGEGGGSMSRFYVTLDQNGQAHKSIGSPHGTWVVVDGEARISWDDGWHDVIKKVGTKHEKFAYEPGRPITDDPSNVAEAKSLNGQTM